MADDSRKPENAPPQKSGGALKWIVFGVLFALIAGGVAGGILWYVLRPQPAAEAVQEGEGEGQGGEGEAAEPKPIEPTGIIALEPFLVNLADKDANRFIRVTLQLAVEDEAVVKLVEANAVSRARLRSAVLEVLTLQTSDRLVTPEGKAELKKTIAERASASLGQVKVLDVLFTDFVVQF